MESGPNPFLTITTNRDRDRVHEVSATVGVRGMVKVTVCVMVMIRVSGRDLVHQPFHKGV